MKYTRTIFISLSLSFCISAELYIFFWSSPIFRYASDSYCFRFAQQALLFYFLLSSLMLPLALVQLYLTCETFFFLSIQQDSFIMQYFPCHFMHAHLKTRHLRLRAYCNIRRVFTSDCNFFPFLLSQHLKLVITIFSFKMNINNVAYAICFAFYIS